MTRKQRRNLNRQQRNTQPAPAPKPLASAASEPDTFESYHEAFIASFRPQTPYERTLVRRCAEYQVSIDRATQAETSFMSECVDRITEDNPGITFERALGLIFHEDRFARKLNLVLRYQSQANRNFRQTLKELEQVLKARLIAQAEAEEAPQAAEMEEDEENGFVWQNANGVASEDGIGIVSETDPAVVTPDAGTCPSDSTHNV